MGLLSKNTAEEEIADELIQENEGELKEFLKKNGINDLKNTLVSIGQNNDISEVHKYMDYTLNRIRYIDSKKAEYKLEAKLADSVYKSYITDGVSRIEKINGRFMASQNIKLDMLIEQNNTIIHLLEQLVDLK